MSVPILFCRISAAARGISFRGASADYVRERLVSDLVYNLEKGHFSITPCSCHPPCPTPTSDQLAQLDVQIVTALNKAKKRRR